MDSDRDGQVSRTMRRSRTRGGSPRSGAVTVRCRSSSGGRRVGEVEEKAGLADRRKGKRRQRRGAASGVRQPRHGQLRGRRRRRRGARVAGAEAGAGAERIAVGAARRRPSQLGRGRSGRCRSTGVGNGPARLRRPGPRRAVVRTGPQSRGLPSQREDQEDSQNRSQAPAQGPRRPRDRRSLHSCPDDRRREVRGSTFGEQGRSTKGSRSRPGSRPDQLPGWSSERESSRRTPSTTASGSGAFRSAR